MCVKSKEFQGKNAQAAEFNAVRPDMKPLRDLGEFEFIDRIRRLIPPDASVLTPIGDDTAVVREIRGKQVLLTTDMFVEGVHFKTQTPPQRIGYKALACNVSDIAAMGGMPQYALVSLGVAPGKTVAFMDALYRGIIQSANKFHVRIVGGDTVKSRRLVINISLLGTARKKDIVCRKGAGKGDVIFVTGPLGRAWKSGKDLCFVPRLAEAQFLLRQGLKPTSMIDISDGFMADLSHILHQSRVGACLWKESIPLAEKAKLRHALYDGEDFELLFTLPAGKARRLKTLRTGGLQFFPVGEIVPGRGTVTLLDRKGRKTPVKPGGFRHF